MVAEKKQKYPQKKITVIQKKNAKKLSQKMVMIRRLIKVKHQSERLVVVIQDPDRHHLGVHDLIAPPRPPRPPRILIDKK